MRRAAFRTVASWNPIAGSRAAAVIAAAGRRRHRDGVTGQGGLGTFSPPLNAAGNSVRGQRITRYLSEALGLNLFASAPTA